MEVDEQVQQLLIPAKIKVGFQERDDTYTKKLGYVIYYDMKGKIRKEKSWLSWCDDKIPSVEYDNVPTEGFVLNKDVGGARRSYGWDTRIEKVRVYDPRGFEFEVSIPNLLFILSVGDCSRGKGLEGKFVYSWERSELILLPTASADYKNSVDFTELQDKKVKAKELITGAVYISKQQDKLVYLGKLDKHTLCKSNQYYGYKQDPALCQKHVFQNQKDGEYVFLEALGTIAKLHSDAVVPDFAERIDAYHKSIHGSKIASLLIKKVKRKASGYYDMWTVEESPGVFLQCYTGEHWADAEYKTRAKHTEVQHRVRMKDGVPYWEDVRRNSFPAGTWPTVMRGDRLYPGKFLEATQFRLFAKMDSGEEYQLGHQTLMTRKQVQDEQEEEECDLG